MDSAELVESMRRLSTERREAQKWLEEEGRKEADHEMAYRKARALAWTKMEGTAKQREDQVDADTALQRYARDLAQQMVRAALEKVRGVRQEMSMFQTFMAVQRAEAELARFDEGTP